MKNHECVNSYLCMMMLMHQFQLILLEVTAIGIRMRHASYICSVRVDGVRLRQHIDNVTLGRGYPRETEVNTL